MSLSRVLFVSVLFLQRLEKSKPVLSSQDITKAAKAGCGLDLALGL